jgi:hypothetical protein
VTWQRRDVDLGDYWTRNGRIYKTLAIADLPTVEIVDVETGEHENHVISSRNFEQFKRLRPTGHDGAIGLLSE